MKYLYFCLPFWTVWRFSMFHCPSVYVSEIHLFDFSVSIFCSAVNVPCFSLSVIAMYSFLSIRTMVLLLSAFICNMLLFFKFMPYISYGFNFCCSENTNTEEHAYTEQLTKAIETIVNQNYFRFNNKIYKQEDRIQWEALHQTYYQKYSYKT